MLSRARACGVGVSVMEEEKRRAAKVAFDGMLLFIRV